MILASGTFENRSNRVFKGHFTIRLNDDGLMLQTMDDFYFSGSPAPGWAFFKGELKKGDPSAETFAMAFRIGSIIRPSGPPHITVVNEQSFKIPDAFNVSKFDGVLAWCYGTPEMLAIGYFRSRMRNSKVHD